MRYRLRTLPLGIALLLLLGVVFELCRCTLAFWAGHPDGFFAGMAAAFACAAALFFVTALTPKGNLKPSEQGGPFHFELRTLLIWLAILPVIIGLAYAYRDWLSDLIIDEWLMRGIS